MGPWDNLSQTNMGLWTRDSGLGHQPVALVLAEVAGGSLCKVVSSRLSQVRTHDNDCKPNL